MSEASKLRDLNDFPGKLSERAYLSLKTAIMSLELQPGEILRKREISERFGVSQAPVSEAVTKLSVEGLVHIVPQSSTRVAKISMATIREEAFLREALELHAVDYAARFRTNEHLLLLKRHMRLQSILTADADYDEFFRNDQDFHEIIFGICGVPGLSDAVKNVSNQINRARLLLLPEPGRINEAYDEHIQIMEAIEGQHVDEARNAMQRHLKGLLIGLEPLEKQRPDLFAR